MNKIIVMFLLMGLVPQAIAKKIKTVIVSDANIRTMVSANGLPDGDEFYLKLVTEVPNGTKITFDSDDFLDKPLYQNDNGKFKRAKALFYGPIKFRGFSRLARKLNKQKLYVYRYNVDLTPIIKVKHNIDVPRGEKKYSRDIEWDRISTKGYFSWAASRAIDEYGRELLAQDFSDAKDFCPNYDNLDFDDRKHFWINLMSSIAKRESAFDPDVFMDESQYQADLDAISRGLLQISYSSSRATRYRSRGCTARAASELTDAKHQFNCAIAIFSFLAEDGCISCKKNILNKETGKMEKRTRGISRYWSTLRKPYKLTCKNCSSGYLKVGKKNSIIAETSKLKICK